MNDRIRFVQEVEELKGEHLTVSGGTGIVSDATYMLH